MKITVSKIAEDPNTLLISFSNPSNYWEFSNEKSLELFKEEVESITKPLIGQLCTPQLLPLIKAMIKNLIQDWVRNNWIISFSKDGEDT